MGVGQEWSKYEKPTIHNCCLVDSIVAMLPFYNGQATTMHFTKNACYDYFQTTTLRLLQIGT